jgi:hypothetical protein
MNPGKDELSTTSYSSITDDLIEKVSEVAESKGITILRFAYDEAVTELCDELDGGVVIDPWPASRPGLAKAKVTVRMSHGIAQRMRETAKRHATRSGIFFRVALIRWLKRHGIEYRD